jgi:hypothetical protein
MYDCRDLRYLEFEPCKHFDAASKKCWKGATKLVKHYPPTIVVSVGAWIKRMRETSFVLQTADDSSTRSR